ncbi:methylthioribulose 1-phosphate dehydratase [Trypanosoma grayi]|uniref:methylthioribulose 1-phosphate dehydratase n=1 Tax=Trypanosoma grayi TaxID=71804 RepID=UPI0004F4807B|nr:methylthioribulose 1-phosphate dehydratase [Trypanosoma grayi]KEG15362.1 methylthioribulose 1-phosphate dehydratase [Trypanosoma grayi]
MTLAETDTEHPFNLIPELCRLFYQLGWATGTGGGISIRHGDNYYVAPSGVQKERLKPEDIFVLDAAAQVVAPPRNTKVVKMSECTPLFFNAFTMRNAGACLHSHSQNAVLVTLLCEKEFRISHIEMVKGIVNPVTKKALNFRDTLVVPIIENTEFESDLTASMAECMRAYPETNAVLVRRHGIYVWGDTWQRAKGMMECFDFLFGLALRMMERGIPLVKDA